MTTPKQREEIQKQSKDIIQDAGGDDEAAKAYLWMIARITRELDDIYDGDQVVTRESLLEILEYLFIAMPTNPFYVQHQDVLLSQHLSMWNAWMAANEAEHGDDLDKIYHHVWRDQIHELIPIVACLTQGHEAMKTVSKKVRIVFKTKFGD